MKIDLNKCKKGDKLRIRVTEGWKKAHKHTPAPSNIVTYIGRSEHGIDSMFPHEIEYSDGSRGTRTDEGWCFKNKRLPDDPDIIEIVEQKELPVDQPKREYPQTD